MKLSRNTWHYKLWLSHKKAASKRIEWAEDHLSLCSYFWTIVNIIFSMIWLRPFLYLLGVEENTKGDLEYGLRSKPRFALSIGVMLNVLLWSSILSEIDKDIISLYYLLSALYLAFMSIIIACLYIRPTEKTIEKIEGTYDLLAAFLEAKKTKVCPKIEVVD